MRYFALATDYDGTLAHDGIVSEPTVAALERFRASGRKLVLVTGRELPDLVRVFPRLDLFDRVVAENGALIYCPATREEQPLGEPPAEAFVAALRQRGVDPLSVGRVIVATWHPNETAVLETIRDLGLELQVIFNKGAVMVLPSGINKAAGLSAALTQLGLSAHNAVGIGDAENDHAFMNLCEASVAVANALPMVKARADYVTAGDHGDGVVELIDLIVDSDLVDLEPRLAEAGIRRIRPGEFTDRQLRGLEQVFDEEIFPVLSPVAVTGPEDFPLLANQALHLLVQLAPAAGSERPRFAVISLRRSSPRFITLHSEGGYAYTLVEDAIKMFVERFFPGERVIEADSWNGLLAPAGTPVPILDRLNSEVNKALASPDVREKLAAQGAMVVGGTRQEFKQYLQDEVKRWGTVFKAVKISL